MVLIMMTSLSSDECMHAAEAFLSSLYGEELFNRWQELKKRMNFTIERDYVTWLIELAYQVQYAGMESHLSVYPHSNGREEVKGVSHDWSSIPPAPVPEQAAPKPRSKVSGGGEVGVRQASTSKHTTLISKNYSVALPVSTKWSMITESMYAVSDVSDAMDVDFSRAETSTICHDLADPSCVDESDVNKLYSTDTDAENRTHFRCSYCSHTAHRKSNIASHIKEVHLKLKKINCQHCSAHFSRKGHLKDHLILKHGYESEYLCGSCQKAFPNASKLGCHQKICSSFPRITE